MRGANTPDRLVNVHGCTLISLSPSRSPSQFLTCHFCYPTLSPSLSFRPPSLSPFPTRLCHAISRIYVFCKMQSLMRICHSHLCTNFTLQNFLTISFIEFFPRPEKRESLHYGGIDSCASLARGRC
jgi:hypothetical protein